MSITKGLEVPGRILPVWTAILILSVPAFLQAQGISAELSKPSVNVKCWDTSGSIVADAGIAADETQGYFADSNGKVFAVDLAAGEISWATEVGGKVRSEIVVSEKRLFIVASGSAGAERPVLRALNTSSGLPGWSLVLPASSKYYVEPTANGVLAVSAEGNIFHLAGGDGTIFWRSSTGSPVAIPPRMNGGRLLIATTGNTVEEFDVTDGRKIASVKVEAVPGYVGAGNDSTAVYSDPKGGVYSIKTNGTRNWKFRSGGRIVFIRPVDGNVLLGSADNFVYFMSIESGNLLWKRRLRGRIANGDLISEKTAIFTVIGERSAYVIELDKGRLVDQISLSGEDAFLLTPIRANGRYLIAATQNGLSAFSADCENQKSGD